MAPGQTAPRPDLEAFDYATRTPFKAVAKELIDILGATRQGRFRFRRPDHPRPQHARRAGGGYLGVQSPRHA